MEVFRDRVLGINLAFIAELYLLSSIQDYRWIRTWRNLPHGAGWYPAGRRVLADLVFDPV